MSLAPLLECLEGAPDTVTAESALGILRAMAGDQSDTLDADALATEVWRRVVVANMESISESGNAQVPPDTAAHMRRVLAFARNARTLVVAHGALRDIVDPGYSPPAADEAMDVAGLHPLASETTVVAAPPAAAAAAAARNDGIDPLGEVVDPTEFQTLVRALTHVAVRSEFGFRCGYVYGRKRDSNGVLTCAWTRVETVREWIDRVTSAVHSQELHELFTGMKPLMPYAQAETYLTTGYIPGFPRLEPDRTIFAFRNGIYFAREHRFHAHADGPLPSPQPVAVNFFDVDLPPEYVRDGIDIPTPAFDRLLNHQGYAGEDLDVLAAIFGRAVFDVGELEDWQIMPYIVGQAGTGKSVLLGKGIQQWYPSGLSGVLDNEVEPVFGFAAMADTYAIFATEIMSTFKMPQSILQKMITGESVSLAQKNRDPAVFDRWTIPIFMGGNQYMGMADNSGAITRRIVPIEFYTPVPDGARDSTLGDAITAEAPLFLVRCVGALHRLIARAGKGSFWSVCPQSFRDAQRRMSDALNPLSAFIRSDDVILRPDEKTLSSDFRRAFREFCAARSMRNVTWRQDLWPTPFQENGLRMELRPTTAAGARMREHVVGCMLADVAPTATEAVAGGGAGAGAGAGAGDMVDV